MADLIRIVNVRGINKPEDRAKIIYVGRAFAGWPASPWGNPFKSLDPQDHRSSLGRYRDWIGRRPELVAELAKLVGDTERPLGCWCCNWDGTGDPPSNVCHAGVLVEAIRELQDEVQLSLAALRLLES